jgi:5'-3' exonuclease
MKHNLAIIDADSLIYLVASKYKTLKVRSSALNDLDAFIMDILKVTYSKEYFGFFGKINGKRNFRYDLAKTKPYKGTRGDKKDWYLYWEKILKNHMENVWGFTPVEYVEADDLCTAYAEKYKENHKYGKIFICSPDKDLKQIENTWVYDYKKRIFEFIDKVKAETNLYAQCIEGDSADNVPGLPKCGETAAKEFKKRYTEENIKDIRKDIELYFKEYLHVIYPEKLAKAAEKEYLANYKLTQGLKRFTKKTKNEALRFFNQGGKLFVPPNEDYYKIQFKEMYNLVLMLRTIKDIQKYWKDYKETKPIKEKYMDWDAIDKEKELIDYGLEDNEFADDVSFLSDDDIDFDDL